MYTYYGIAHSLVEGDSYSSVSRQVLVNEGHHNAIVQFSGVDSLHNVGTGNGWRDPMYAITQAHTHMYMYITGIFTMYMYHVHVYTHVCKGTKNTCTMYMYIVCTCIIHRLHT